MSNTADDGVAEKIRLPRHTFRKQKKLEKRRSQRQIKAKERPIINEPEKSVIETSRSLAESIIEKQEYERQKGLWEEREQRFKAIELAKLKAKQKQEKAKELSQKRWKDTLLNLPMMPPRFSLSKTDKRTPFKTFVQPDQQTNISSHPLPTTKPKKTYRERFQEQKRKG